jgi:hypothetical protein
MVACTKKQTEVNIPRKVFGEKAQSTSTRNNCCK